jgi:hypothetical protein
MIIRQDRLGTNTQSPQQHTVVFCAGTCAATRAAAAAWSVDAVAAADEADAETESGGAGGVADHRSSRQRRCVLPDAYAIFCRLT